ncbi:TLC domain-containing protein 2 [Saguinus oedipus]|uniref:TLC domain-containing protein 2 n=1 Tax=Saguinus oedipus TaxID=9490 RepID=A0ABQ9VNV4_SAGOE|nr:TLC domain-containing protein 2 [Saguinus oedipus]
MPPPCPQAETLHPQMAANPIQSHPRWALVLVAVSIGLGGPLTSDPGSQVVSCLSTAVLSSQYTGFPMVSLLLELNSACLQLRKLLLLLLSRQAPSLAFSMTSWASLATLALFHLVPLGLMSLWLLQQRHEVPLALVILGGVGLATAGIMSILLGIRVLVSDVLRFRPRPSIPGHEKTRRTRTCGDDGPITRDRCHGRYLGEMRPGPEPGDDSLQCTVPIRVRPIDYQHLSVSSI